MIQSVRKAAKYVALGNNSIHFIHECDEALPGLNIKSITDGGFALVVRLGKLRLYWRWRGKRFGIKPRIVRDWDWVR